MRPFDEWHLFPQLRCLIAMMKISQIMQGQCALDFVDCIPHQVEFKQQISTISSVRWNDNLLNCMFSNHSVVGRQQKRQQWGKTGGSLARRPPRMFGSSFTTILSCCCCCCTGCLQILPPDTAHKYKLLFVQCPLPHLRTFGVHYSAQPLLTSVCMQCILCTVQGIRRTRDFNCAHPGCI